MTRPRPRLLLASASPRRRELLARLGLALEVAAPDVDETPCLGEAPAEYARRLARRKAGAVIAPPDAAVLAADTVVALGDRIFGKPRDRAEALAMLGELAGRTHAVVTAVVVRWEGREADHLEAAEVTMAPLDRSLARWYASTGEGDDKAGAYAVQGKGALLVEKVAGNVQAVVGLPLAALPELLRRVGLRLVPGRDGLQLARQRSRRDRPR